MALISCPGCGKQISDSVKTCVHCGRKLTEKDKLKNNIDKNVIVTKSFISKNKKLFKIILPILLAIIVVGIIVYAMWYNSGVQVSRRLAEAAAATLEDTREQLEVLEQKSFDMQEYYYD
ncbi:MAG: zinc ribbon domain-containing protein [Clostridia bacterium]|nr:zinc ribbon domain-containing protein [Clostridia bacterium]